MLDVVFIMLINVKMPTIVGILTFYEHGKVRAQLSWAWKKFYNLRFCLYFQHLKCLSEVHMYHAWYVFLLLTKQPKNVQMFL